MVERPRVVIIGAGLSGLTTAYRLAQSSAPVQVTLLEARDRPGGNIWTDDRDGFRVENGPNGFLDSKPTTLKLCNDLGLGGQLLAGSEGSRKNRYVYWGGRMQAFPNSLWSFATSRLLSLRGKFALLREKYRRPGLTVADETVSDFVRRRAGREAAELFADAMVTGIHGGDPELLSARAAFPRMIEFEAKHGSIMRGMTAASKERKRQAKARGEPYSPPRMWSFREGLRKLVEQLQAGVGGSLHLGARVEGLRYLPETRAWEVQCNGATHRAEHLVLACPAYEQAALLEPVNPELARELGEIRYNRIAVVALGFRAEDCPGNLDGFGYIAPQRLRRDLLGVQWCSSIFPDRAPPGCVLWRALCGGVHRGEMVDWSDDQLAKAVYEELRHAQGVRNPPVFRQVVRWPRAIPQYLLGHGERVHRIESLQAATPWLHLTGNALRGVAMNDCVEDGERVAALIAAVSRPAAQARPGE